MKSVYKQEEAVRDKNAGSRLCEKYLVHHLPRSCSWREDLQGKNVGIRAVVRAHGNKIATLFMIWFQDRF